MSSAESASVSRRSRRPSSRIAAAATVFMAAAGAAVATAPAAEAWPWSGSVFVLGTTTKCGVSAGSGWGWFTTSDGESGWMNYNNGGQFSFQLNRVSSSGSIVTFKWGLSGCTGIAHKVISRPTFGTSAGIGVIG